MSDFSSREGDRLSPETAHQLQTLLSNLRAQEQMVTRWMRRQGAGGDIDVMLERLAIVDKAVMQLVAAVRALEEREPPTERGSRGDVSESR